MDSGRTIGTSPHPVFLHERIDLIDVVRGFALFGVLLSNLVWITTDVVLTDARLSQLPTAPLDRIVKPVVEFFVDHKFYTLFSFLFGLGFAIQLSRGEERRYNVVAVYGRRVSILAVIGLLHIAFIWYGDILLVYAIGGFGLLAVRHWNTRLLVTLALALALFARAAVGVSPPIARAPDSPQVNARINANAEKERMLAIFDGTSYQRYRARERRIVLRGHCRPWCRAVSAPASVCAVYFWTMRWPTQLGSTHDRTPPDSAPAPAVGHRGRRHR